MWGWGRSHCVSGSSGTLWNPVRNLRCYTSAIQNSKTVQLKVLLKHSTYMSHDFKLSSWSVRPYWNKKKKVSGRLQTLKYMCRMSLNEDAFEAKLSNWISSWIHWITLFLNQSRSDRKHTTTKTQEHKNEDGWWATVVLRKKVLTGNHFRNRHKTYWG